MQLKISAIDAKKDITFPMMMLMGKLKISILLPIIVFFLINLSLYLYIFKKKIILK